MTLHSVISEIRLILKYGAILIVSLVFLIIVFRFGKIIKEKIAPTPPPSPSVEFGKLPGIIFSQENISTTKNRDFTYKINTLTGDFPNFLDRISVYKIVRSEPSLLAFRKAEDLVSKVIENVKPTPLSETVYQWIDSSEPPRKLILNILSYNFTLSSDFYSDPMVISAKNLPNETATVSEAEYFLSQVSLPTDLDSKKTKTTLLSIKNSTLNPATSLSNAQLIRVDFFQKDINDIPIYYFNSPYSTMNVFIGSGANSAKVVEANFFHQNISEVSATYPIKTTKEAFNELKEGKAYISSHEGAGNEISVKNVIIGYYLGQEEQDFLMPVIVFEGDNNFLAFISAIKEEWINK